METPRLTEQECAEIVEQIHRREFVERTAIEQQKKLRQAESERYHREALAIEARKVEEERKERLINSLASAVSLLQNALGALQENNDERRCYLLLCKADPVFYATKHQLNKAPERSTTALLPTLKVRASNPLGFAIINAEDLTPAHEVLEDSE
jgi:hypothetical protein